MVDTVDAVTRSRMMSGIRARNTRPEVMVRSLLHRKGYRFRLHVGELPGKPDIVLPRYHAVILVHGCFWHGHDCALFKWPKTRIEFWSKKIEKNRQNDEKVQVALRAMGWRVAVVWECALKGREKLESDTVADRLATWLQHEEQRLEVRG
ncbi:very short patch repair endonuclease [Burkholderia ubonensis]|uniref:very short patch repair endonuclease n=1 Tax=Burkholderia ubonensis TaxID=101571 RepID=UPI0009B3C332|nr:very short patch repair endonuclease [Burkholderia ubonensis]